MNDIGIFFRCQCGCRCHSFTTTFSSVSQRPKAISCGTSYNLKILKVKAKTEGFFFQVRTKSGNLCNWLVKFKNSAKVREFCPYMKV